MTTGPDLVLAIIRQCLSFFGIIRFAGANNCKWRLPVDAVPGNAGELSHRTFLIQGLSLFGLSPFCMIDSHLGKMLGIRIRMCRGFL